MGQTKNPDELSPVEAAQLLAKGVVGQIDKHLAVLRSGLSKMQEREAEGVTLAKKSRSVFDLVKSEGDKYNHYLVHRTTGKIHGGFEYKEDALEAANDHHEPVKVSHRSKVSSEAKEAFHRSNGIMGKLQKDEDLIDSKHRNDPEKRIKTFKSPGTVGPLDKPQKRIPADASGDPGDKIFGKSAMPASPPAAKQPSGVPGAPKPPQAAGAAPTMHKMALPTTPEKANGGPQPTQKMEIPSSAEKANGGPQPTKKMEMPTTPEKANGGPMAKAALSPVFAVRPRLGGKDQASQQMSAHAFQAQVPQNTMALPKTTLPSVADHANRANNFAGQVAQGGHTPKVAPAHNAGGLDLPPDDGTTPEIHTGASQFGLAPAGYFGKKEMDSMKCPKCKAGMSECKCYNSGKGK
jgi:hypothetical protein